MQLTILLWTRKTSYITKKLTLSESECEKKQWMPAKDNKWSYALTKMFYNIRVKMSTSVG